MADLEQYVHQAQQAVTETAQSFHLQATTNDGLSISVPCSYQILEPGFRPFRAGKASAQELQDELDNTLSQAESLGIDAGIEGHEAVRKLSIQLGLGIDCSNFAYRSLTLLHERLGLGAYTDYVYREGAEIRKLHKTRESWTPKSKYGNPRMFTGSEADTLRSLEQLDATWIAAVFRKDPAFIISSKHMSMPAAAKPLQHDEVLPGDLIAFNKAGTGAVSHIAVVESTDAVDEQAVRLNFWHAWHTRDFQAGLRRDSVQTDGSTSTWSHEGLGDPARYKEYFFCRPIGMAAIAATLG